MKLASSLVLASLLLFTLSAQGQDNRPDRPPAFVSTEVTADRDVIFRVWAPKATQVRLNSGDIPSQPNAPPRDLVRNEQGLWEIKLSAVPSGSYRYTFNIDGVAVVDPKNTASSASNGNIWSLIYVPGSSVSDTTDVPHGSVSAIEYQSSTLQKLRRAHVYLPPGYEKSSQEYPVFYLLHGASDSDASWSTVGRAGAILDNLIAAGKAKPMIIVMPAGHTASFEFGGRNSSFQTQMEEFLRDFQTDLRPHIENRYRTSNRPEHRAIAGLSMGGAQTIDIAIANLKDFAYIGVFSSGVFGIDRPAANANQGESWPEKNRAVLNDPELKKGIKLFWFATGKEDFLLKTTQETVKVLRDHQFDIEYEETDGGHTWIKWREHYLPAFAQKLFP